MLDAAAGMAFIIVGTLLIVVLLGILKMVHEQTEKVRELEARMKATEDMEAKE